MRQFRDGRFAVAKAAILPALFGRSLSRMFANSPSPFGWGATAQ